MGESIQLNSVSGNLFLSDTIDIASIGPIIGQEYFFLKIKTPSFESDGDINFSITPNDLTDDYDWAVYDLSNSNCADIYTDASLEVSCNYSGASGVTGPNGGPNLQEEPVIPVLTGSVYTVVISNFSSSQSGYTIDFSPSTANIYDTSPPSLDSIASVVSCGVDTIQFAFSENVLCSTISASDLQLTGPGGPFTISNVRGDACQLGASYERAYTFDVSPALSNVGTYTLSMAPGALTEDNCGNLIDLVGTLDFQLSPMPLSKDSTMVTCFGASDGTASAVTVAGQSPFTYSWDDPGTQSGSTATGLAPGTYNVTVTDNVGCVATESVVITEPDTIDIVLSSSDMTCFGVCNGTSSATISGGTSASGTYSSSS